MLLNEFIILIGPTIPLSDMPKKIKILIPTWMAANSWQVIQFGKNNASSWTHETFWRQVTRNKNRVARNEIMLSLQENRLSIFPWSFSYCWIPCDV